MSLIAIDTIDAKEIPIGKSVVIDATSMKVRVFDSESDSLDDIVGVSYPKSGTLGRICANTDGLGFSDFDYLTLTETLQYLKDENGDYVENPNYDASFNPVVSSAYAYVALLGMVPVLKSEPVPLKWKLIRVGTAYDIFLIC